MKTYVKYAFLFVSILAQSAWAAAPKTVLVTGASGFVGGQMVRRLLAEGIRVRVLVRDPSKLNPEFVGKVAIYQGDLNDPGILMAAVEEVDAVVHAAAYVSDFAIDPDIYERSNVEGTQAVVSNVAQESLKHPIRLLHVSTVDVAKFDKRRVITEESPYETSSRYGYPYSKALAEQHVFEMFRQHQALGNRNFEVTAVRPTWLFGPGDQNFIPGIVKALNGGTPILIGGRQKQVHLNYIDNLIDVMWLLLMKEEAVGKAFISDDGPRTWGWVEDTILKTTGAKPPWMRSIPFTCGVLLSHAMEAWAIATNSAHRPDLTPFIVHYLFSNMHYSSGRLKRELGYEPRLTIEEGMATTLKSYGY